MANRHLSRSIVLQTLFEWDFLSEQKKSDLSLTGGIKDSLKRNLNEFAPGVEDDFFASSLLEKILKKRTTIDEIIEKAAPDWPIDKISVIDRNILRIGLTELLFGDRTEVPPKVAINESIELAKTFGGENSGKFINGVLGAVYKEMGEPGKEQESKKKRQDEPLDMSKIPVEKKGGALVYAEHDGKIMFAMVHDVFGYWTISKGGIDGNEEEK
jgi:N utilization substance protein B